MTFSVEQIGMYKLMLRPKPDTDKHIAEGVIVRNEYDLNYLDFQGIKTIMDLGGHIGSFSIGNSALVEKVYVFEPDPIGVALIKENLKLNSIKNVQVIQAAVAATSGKQTFHLGGTSARNTLYDITFTNQVKHYIPRTITVDVIDIKHVLTDYPTNGPVLLKMDVEGAEYDIMDRLDKDLLKSVNVVVMEAHTYPDKPWHYFKLTAKLYSLGFKVVSIIPILTAKETCTFTIKAIRRI